jgi:hypothetical protein
MLLVAVVRAVRNLRRGARRPIARGARVAGWIIMGVCLLNLLFLVGVALKFPPTQPSELHDIASITEVVIGLGVLAALLTAGAVVCTVMAWKNGYWGGVFRAYYTLVTVAAVTFVWFLDYWKWLGWRY